jgi:8-oxo-dGTP pyrophosphatase MutT (NUDIX family)
MNQSEVILRRAARVLIIDSSGRLLLLRGCDPVQPEDQFWFTVGGGIDPGETAIEAAIRELSEEIGLAVKAEALGQPISCGEAQFSFDNQYYHQNEVFYVLHIAVPGDALEISSLSREDIEKATISAHRWWSIEELENTEEVFFPAELTDLLRDQLRARSSM